MFEGMLAMLGVCSKLGRAMAVARLRSIEVAFFADDV